MKIKINKCFSSSAWYSRLIGQTINVERFEKYKDVSQGIPEDVYWCREGGVFNCLNYVLSSDAELISDDIKRSSYDWLKEERFKHIQILDPDGWDRRNLENSMSELITENEFNKRVNYSTISYKPEVISIYFVKFDGNSCAFENLNSAIEELKSLAAEDDDGFEASLEIKKMARQEYENMPEFGGW